MLSAFSRARVSSPSSGGGGGRGRAPAQQRGGCGSTARSRERGPSSPFLSPTRAREVLMMAGAGGAMRATGWRATAIRFQQFGEGRVPHALRVFSCARGGPSSAGGRSLPGAGACYGDAADRQRDRANEGTSPPAFTISLTHSRARGADDGGRRRRDASYGVARDSHPVSTIR